MTCGQPGGGNSIQALAQCTIGVPIVGGQDPQAIGERMIAHLLSQEVPYGLEVEAEIQETAAAFKADIAG